MKNTILRDAVRIAREKLPRHPQKEHWPHYSFIIQNNKIVEWSTNTGNEPAPFYGYHLRINWGLPKSHAETNSYRKAKGLLIPNKPFEIINIRLSRNNGELRMSAPCNCCHQFLALAGCSVCWFSTQMGFAKLNIAS